jgi:hypothetical protein
VTANRRIHGESRDDHWTRRSIEPSGDCGSRCHLRPARAPSGGAKPRLRPTELQITVSACREVFLCPPVIDDVVKRCVAALGGRNLTRSPDGGTLVEDRNNPTNTSDIPAACSLGTHSSLSCISRGRGFEHEPRKRPLVVSCERPDQSLTIAGQPSSEDKYGIASVAALLL